jgi:membrane-associated phospholipid phosphatase
MQPITETAAARRLLWTVLAASMLMLPALAATRLSISLSSFQGAIAIVAFLVPFMIYTRWRKMAVLPATFDCIAAVLVLAVPILVWTYAAMRMNMPLADHALAAMDEGLGFHWRAFIGFVDARPYLSEPLALAYSSFPFQLLLLPALLSLAGKPCRAYAMVFAYALVGLVSSVIGIFFPAVGAYVLYGLGQEDLVNINAKFGYFFLEQFHSVRAAETFTILAEKSAGILTFPSVHAAVAAICAWAAWDVRVLRWPVLVLNILMAVSAVSHGSHYLIDVIAGLGTAGLCISITTAVFYQPAQRRSPVLASVGRCVEILRARASSHAAASG